MARRASRVGLLAALMVALCVLAPAGAYGFSKAIWGEPYQNGVNQFPLYKQLGVSTMEIGLNWNLAAPRRPRNPGDPNDPAYAWPPDLQQTIDLARQYHMRVMVVLVFAPSWANGGRSVIWMPKRPSDFAAFAAATARRYPSVHLWMIWSEASRSERFMPFYQAGMSAMVLNRRQQIAPHNYARLLDAAYGSLKRVSRRNQVIGGATYSGGEINAFAWVKYLRLPNGRPPRMDMYGHNPFSIKDPNFSDPPSGRGISQFSDLQRFASWLDRNLRPGLPLFLSEFTIPTCPDQEFNFYVDPPVAARWVRDALRLSRRWHRISTLGWIHVYDDPTSCGGLLTASGKRKPTFNAFARG